jgi:glycosyltransferase involved in cell wall biosynthesis
VLEAMRCGTPVVCSDVSSLPELAGEAALTVPPTDVDRLADALRRVLTDEALRSELIARGFEQAGRFTWEACARATLAVIERAAG